MKTVLDTHNALNGQQSAARAVAKVLRAIEPNAGVREMLKSIERTGQLMATFEARFRLPEMPEVVRLMTELRTSPLSSALTRFSEQASTLQLAMESMQKPWLDVHEKMRSLTSFAKLQGIGHALRIMPTFSENLSAALRIDLGDWRDPITWRPEVLSDLKTRSAVYNSLGFNRALTDFPAPAFQESLDIAGLRQEPPSLVDLYGALIPRSDNGDEENALERTNMAHDWLLRLETQLRAFIDEEMTRTGQNVVYRMVYMTSG